MTGHLDMAAEEAHKREVADCAYEAFLELRDTLSSHYDAKGLGYKDADHARLTIVQFANRRINKLAADHFKKQGK